MDPLKLQHIATKNALLGVLKLKYDYWETMKVGDIVHMQEDVMFENAKNDDAVAELAQLRADLAAAVEALNDVLNMDPRCVIAERALARLEGGDKAKGA